MTEANTQEKIMTIKYFHAEWCGPCDQQKSIITEIETETNHDVERIDIEENQQKANEYNVRSLPSVIVEKDGVVEKQFTGVTDKNSILSIAER